MDWGLFFQALSIGVAVLGIVIAGFWRMWALIKDVRQEANLRAEAAIATANVSRNELAAHKLHIAETYVTKAGMSEQTAQIMKAIDGVAGKLDHLNGRIDGLMQPKTVARSRSS